MSAARQDDRGRIAAANRTDAPFPSDATVHGLIEAQVARHRSGPAVICEQDHATDGPSITYQELNGRANRVARLLGDAGVGPDDVVALSVERSYAMIVGLLGILKTGAAYLPLAPDNPPARSEYQLQDASVRFLLAQPGVGNPVQFAGKVIDMDEIASGGDAANPDVRMAPTELAYVIYTSGSTGRPKGVMVEHRSVVNRLHWMQHAYPIDTDDVILQKTPYYFDVSVWELFWPLLQGARLCLLPPGGEKHPLAIIESVRKHHVSTMHFVPSMLTVFLEYLDGRTPETVRDELGSVRRVFCSGEALTPSHVARFNERWGDITGTRLTNLYGPTEATVDVSYYDCPPGVTLERVPIGRPIDNTRFYVLKDGAECGVGEAGELCIAGVGLARGYLNNPDLTAQRFRDHPTRRGERIYRTGDAVRWLADGNVEFLGREDDQVKIRGLRIELGEIESVIRAFPSVSDCVVVVKRHSETVVVIVAYVVSKAPLATDALKQHLRQRLPEYMVPGHVEEIPAVPLTPSGKADRRALPEPTLRATVA